MRKITLLVVVLVASFANAQVNYPESSAEVFSKKHELRVGTIRLLTGNSLDVGYEYILDTNQGFGANLLLGFGNDDFSFNQQFSFSPYYRFYFNKSEEYGARGMFVEGFMDFYSGENDYYGDYYYEPSTGYGYYYDTRREFFEVAAGFALGWKWVNRMGFVLDIKAGYGRNLLNEDSAPEGLFRGDVSVGYRF